MVDIGTTPGSTSPTKPSPETLFRRGVKVSVWQETVPSDPTSFNPKAFNQIDITNLRVQFKIEKSLTKSPNTGDITITNLAESTRAWLTKRPLIAQINAGYGDNLKLLFAGDVRFSMSELKPPNWETLLQLGDGDCHFRWARVNRSWPPGTTVRTVVTAAAASMGLVLPKNLATDGTLDTQIISGTASFGAARDELTRLLSAYGYSWSIQNGALQVLRDDQVNTQSAIPIDEAHGMIGTPEFGSPPRSGKPPHMKVKMLLYPTILPGDLVQVTSIAKKGRFRVSRVTHRGDTHGAAWETDLEILPV